MQKKVLLFAALAVLVVTGLAIVQSRHAATAKAQAEAAQQKAEADAKELAEQRATIERLQKQKSSLSKQVQTLAAKQESMPIVSTDSKSLPQESSEETNSPLKGKGSFLANMLKDPNMKEMIRAQQKVMVNMMYGDFFKEMNFSPEEKEKLTALMLDNQMEGMEKGMSLLNGEGDKEELKKSLAQDKKAYEAQLKEFLGDERYAQYEDYTKTLSDRMTMTHLKSQFGDNPLTEEQSGKLLGVMKEERQRLNVDGSAAQSKDFAATLSDEAMNKYFADQEQINSRVLERASGILTQEQLEILGRSLTNQLAMQKAGMSMARSMFAPEKKSNDGK